MKTIFWMLALALSAATPAQNRAAMGCPADWPALTAEYRVYAEASRWQRMLADHGIVVTCMAPSHMDGMFEGQVGAALSQTSAGTFETLFLPPPNTFDALVINERREGGRYQYSFAGRPKPWPANLMDGPRPTYFVRYENRLMIAFDEEVAATLRKTFGVK